MDSRTRVPTLTHRTIVFVCTAALAILDRLDVVDVETLGWWLAERQLPNGGLNGRPEKLEDVSLNIHVSSFMVIAVATNIDCVWLLIIGLLQLVGFVGNVDSGQAALDRR